MITSISGADSLHFHHAAAAPGRRHRFPGRPAGVGLKRSPPNFSCDPGDIAEVEISGIGVLRNPVIAEAA